jgi:hypothetical protein
MMYDAEKFATSISIPVSPVEDLSTDVGSVGACLLAAEEQQTSNQGCMNDLLDQSPIIYWRYENITAAEALDRRNIDACIVFSGPARHPDPFIAEEFQKCSENYLITGCKIPQMVYSSGSSNRVPVANVHMVDILDKVSRREHAEALFQSAQESALTILRELENFASDNLDVVLFSGEGDSLHQIFDCIMMGPYAKVDMWSKGSTGTLNVPNWARDTNGLGLSRTMDLPCDASKLNGDFKPPFTCGGQTRRSIIKHFVRDYYPSSGDVSSKGGNSDVINLIRAQVKRLEDAWSDSSKYSCTCTDGTSDFDCCTTFKVGSTSDDNKECVGNVENVLCTNNFLPVSLTVEFDEISASDVIESVMRKIPDYAKSIFTDVTADAFKAWNDEQVHESWNWDTSGVSEIASSDNMYTSYSPLMNYSSGDVGYPFKGGKSIWHMCTGLISQVMFTMPMRTLVVNSNTGDWMWTAASVLGLRNPLLEFDPTLSRNFAGAEDGGTSMLEEYVQKLLENSFADSSMFWHYAMRHVPSDSIACAKNIVVNPTPEGSLMRFSNTNTNVPDLDMTQLPDVSMYGYSAHTIGEVSSGCFCGWKLTGSECKIPSDICIDIAYEENNPDCTYTLGSTEGRDVVALALSMWGDKGSWDSDAHSMSPLSSSLSPFRYLTLALQMEDGNVHPPSPLFDI